MKPLYLFISLFLCVSGVIEAQTNPPQAIADNVLNATTTFSHSHLSNAPSRTKIGNGSDGISSSFFAQDICGLNYATGSVMTQTRTIASGFNTNGTGFPTTITIGSLPANCMVVEFAYLYFDASYTEATVPAVTTTITNPALATANYPATEIGTDVPKCWGETGTASYRTDVTAAISGNGVYTISMNGFANAAWEVDGCTLFIIYISGPSATTSGSMFLCDGAWVENTTKGPGSDSVSGFDVCASSANAQAFFIIADASDQAPLTTNVETANKTTMTFPNDMWNYNSIPTTVATAQASTTFYPYRNNPISSTDDCYNWVMAGMYWQNSNCYDCLPIIDTPTVANGYITEPKCNGDKTGKISANISNGWPPYTYNWSTGQTTSSVTGLSAGTYTITIEDAICSTTTLVVTITQPAALVATTTMVPATCGANNGTATVNASGGTSPYTYSWTPGAKTTATITGLSAGTYTVIVKDAHSCSITTTIVVTSIVPQTVSISAHTNVSCKGGSNGTATSSVSGGTSPYTYSWSPGGQSNANASGLTAGTYTIYVTDSNGCVEHTTITITQPAAGITAAITASTNIACFGGTTGSATSSATGGTSPYTYSWAPSGGSTAIASGLSIGTYTVTITDANGCSSTASVVLTQPAAALATTTTMTPASCGGNNGSTTATVSGGTGPYTYSWAPGAKTSSNVSGLSSGTYTVYVTDAKGCTSQSTINITTTSAITSSITSTVNVSCFGGNNGSSTVTASSGVTPYTYSWAPGGQSNANATGLSAGNYTVYITDANGCTSQSTVTITQPASALTATITASTNIACFGGTTGSATVVAAGGTTPYTYVWTPAGGSLANATGLSANSYTITITDANGCTASSTITLTQPAAALATTTTMTPASCGNSNGSATATVSGGTGPYTYSWAPSAKTSSNVSGLSAGTYTVYVTDAKGCTSQSTITITTTSAVTSSITSTVNVNCFGGTTGSSTVTASSGVTPYTYSWAPGGQSNANATGLSAGNYTVYITDANGCTSQSTVTITQPASALTANITASTNIACFGGTTGSITVVAAGGSTPYTYSWTPSGGSSAIASGLSANSYTITITDANGCTATSTITLTQPAAALATTTTMTPASCGNSNGSATATVSGGTGPYTYSWAPGGQSITSISGLSAGTYTVYVTDAKGCTSQSTVIVSSSSAVTSSITSTVNVNCFGGTTGSSTVTASSGVTPYTYSWAPGGQSNANATGLSAGNYTVYITDANGCTSQSTVTITQPASAFTATITASTNIACFGGTTGSITVVAAGGSTPYTYSWSPSGGSTANATGLSANSYTITITDANGCTATSTITLTQPAAALATTTTMTPASCGNSNGSATATVSGGTGPYTYSWAPSAKTSSNVSGLSAGIYTVYVTDAKGCTSQSTITITTTSAVTSSITSTVNVNCFGGNNGSSTVTASSGVTPYTYSWAPGGQSNASATGLSAGNYTVYITDANGCTSQSTVTITQPASALTANITASTNIACFGGTTGSITVVAAGGSTPYTYSWSPSGGSTANATGLSANSYTITITDANGCTATSTITLTQPAAALATTTTMTPASCGNSNGSATATVSGGTGPYTYSWAPGGQSITSISGLSAGTYTVYVTDAKGCTSQSIITITSSSAVTSSITSTVNVSCFGGTTGSSTVTASSGVTPYTYSWAPGGQSNANATGLSAGNYTVYITDANGCTSQSTVTITQPTSALTATITASTNIACFGGTTGNITVVAAGGSTPYTYSWSPSGGSTANATGLSANSYTITITDANGCTATSTITLTQPAAALATTTTMTPASCGNSNGSATATVSGGTGPYTYSWAPSGGSNPLASGLSAGTYTVFVTDANGCTFSISASITQPSTISSSITSSVNALCFGGTNGSATVSVSGGISPYTYSWSPNGGTGPTGTGLSAGLYTVSVSDSSGCTLTDTITISQPALLTATMGVPTNVLCNGATNGSATVNVSGGTSPYTYNWSLIGGTNSTGTGFSAGTYTVNITDANGCTTSATISITQPTLITLNTTSNNVPCNGASTGSAAVSASGGTSPYTYSWSPVSSSNTIVTALSAGTYTITITDANGCTASAPVIITQPNSITASVSTTPAICGRNNGSATVSPGGGSTPYTYSWSPSGGSNALASNLSAGTYTITITDSGGCSLTTTAIISQPSSVSSSIISTVNVLCNGGSTGSATVSATGGFTPYTYSWSSSGGSNATATGLSAGLYTITTTDSAGCITTSTVNITQPQTLSATISASVNVSCYGGNTGSATVIVSGGVSPYTYSWTPSGGSNATATGLSAGTYTVIITDANNCKATASVVITQPSVFSATTTTINVSCNGGGNGSVAVIITGGSSPFTYSWSPITSTSSIISALSAGTYTIIVTDAGGCTASATASITEPPPLAVSLSNTNISCFGANDGNAKATPSGGASPYTYLWSNGVRTQNISSLSAGTYTITVTDANNCTTTASITITEPASPLSVSVSGSSRVCFGAPDKLTSSASGGTGPYTFSWAPSGANTDTTTVYPTATTTYTVFITDANGCTAQATITVNVDSPLNVVVAGKTSYCPGGSTTLAATASGGDGIYTFLWLPGGNTNSYITVSPTTNTTYTVELKDGCGSSMATATITITIDPYPTVSFIANPSVGCSPLCVEFRSTTTISSGGLEAYGWSFGNGDTSSSRDPISCYKDTGTYSVNLTVTSDSGCSSTFSSTDLIKVYSLPVANFTYTPDPVTILAPLVQFTNTSTGKFPIYQWFWKFGDGTSGSFDKDPSHLYSDTGTYCVDLEISDIHGCIDSITKCIDVEPAFTFYIPDAFTPNGDGINDIFQPKGSYIRSYEMYIFDRWGMQLYHTTDFYTGWNGLVNNVGLLCQEDTYVYVIYVFDSEGVKHTYTGRVNLIR